MPLQNSKDHNRRNAVIVRTDEEAVLHSYSDEGGPAWCDDLEDAWRFDAESKIAARIAHLVGGAVTPISQLV